MLQLLLQREMKADTQSKVWKMLQAMQNFDSHQSGNLAHAKIKKKVGRLVIPVELSISVDISSTE